MVYMYYKASGSSHSACFTISAVEHDGGVKMRGSVPSARYSSICNVLRLWSIWLIPTYRVVVDSMIIILFSDPIIYVRTYMKNLRPNK